MQFCEIKIYRILTESGKSGTNFNMEKSILLDMDGTLVNNWHPYEGAVELIDFLNKSNIAYFIVTNRVSKTVEQIGENLRQSGFNVVNERILNPLIALNKYIIEHNIETYYFVGPEFQKQKITESKHFDNHPEYVILCDFENIECNYGLLNKIYQYILKGSKMIATSYSNFYASGNSLKMDTGIFVKMYELLTQKKAKIIGKPSTEILEIAVTELRKPPRDVTIIGDDGISDIEGGKKLGMKTILVKTGIYKDGDEGKYGPNLVISSLKEIEKIISI
jgi:HAD superfamily hydrolase (TIGR01450 family)